MRLARHGEPGLETPIVAGEDGTWRDLRSVTPDIDSSFLSAGLGEARRALARGSLPEIDAATGRFGPPIADIGKIVCIGLNYADHARETGAAIPSEPVVFLKAHDTVVGPNDRVLIPRSSTKTDWEVELAVVIGSEARYLDSPSEAVDHIVGYTISNDVSERAFQLERGGQWDKGKNCETFNPIGPWLADRDEISDPQGLDLRLWVNGELRQSSSTKNMVFDVAHLVWYVSQFMVLHPGDVINTGTPHGVALGLPGNPYLRAGDVVDVEIDGLGHQRQQFAQA
jgi:2-keto-4-pentenoate hydratase/2-oxohepta-3-ene-1,7-dioic acid hydratase in catechol pathway